MMHHLFVFVVIGTAHLLLLLGLRRTGAKSVVTSQRFWPAAFAVSAVVHAAVVTFILAFV